MLLYDIFQSLECKFFKRESLKNPREHIRTECTISQKLFLKSPFRTKIFLSISESLDFIVSFLYFKSIFLSFQIITMPFLLSVHWTRP